MKHKSTIALAVSGTLVFLLALLTYVVQAYPQLQNNRIVGSFYNPLVKAKKSTVNKVVKPSLTPPSQETIFQLINQYRTDNQLQPFEKEKEICTDNQLTKGDPSSLNDELVFSVCADCSHTAVITLPSVAPEKFFLSQLDAQLSAREILLNPKLTHLCVKQQGRQATLLFTAYHPKPTPAPTPVLEKQEKSAPLKVTNFSEDELWQALIDYRHAHKKSDLNRNEKLCSYARERVEEHIKMFNEKDKSEYPVEEKYPLDAHAGFGRDAETGHAFEKTGMHELAENLAFWPTAQSPVHIIEWGWDTSTEGHRETQLTEKYFHACITGRNGFYVALFGN